MKTLLLSVGLTLLGLPGFAQSADSMTQTASVSGVVNCVSVLLTVTKTTNTEVRTWLQLAVKDCPAGSTTPTHLVASVSQLIPDSDFNATNQGMTLDTSTPSGPIHVRWTPTKTTHNTYSAVWTWNTDGQSAIRETETTDTRSAAPVGTVLSYGVDNYQAYVMVGMGTKR